jgi:plastocyanin
MSPQQARLRLAAPVILIAAIAWIGCSNSNSPSAPVGGGGGSTGPNFNSSIIQPGSSFSFTFPDSGTFGYRCGVHPAVMFGNRIIVTATSSVDSIVVNIVGTSTPGFSPSAATIKIGGTIRWVNVHSVPHSVERT